MPTYNPNEAKELVETLQKHAVAVRIKSPAYFAALAMVLVGWLKLGQDDMFFAFVAAIPGGLFGYEIGYIRSIAIRVQIQTLLCQMKIEENTRN